MGEILRLWTMSFSRIMLGSGLNGGLAYFNLSQVGNITTQLQIGQLLLGIACAFMALAIGFFQIRFTIKRTRLVDKQLKESKDDK